MEGTDEQRSEDGARLQPQVAKIVNGRRVRLVEPPAGKNAKAAVSRANRHDVDAVSWKVRKRAVALPPSDFTETVVIQASFPKNEDFVTQIQRPPASKQADVNNKNGRKARSQHSPKECPPTFFRQCFPGRSKPRKKLPTLIPSKAPALGACAQRSAGQVRIDPLPELIPFLPPQLPRDRGKKTLVLDLDETLVRSTFSRPAVYTFTVKVELDGKERCIYINRRPGVTVFLQEVAKWFEVVIFTASVSQYADLVVDKLDLLNVCSHRLFREYCTFINGTFVKDLSLLGRELRNIIIVDNSTRAYLWHAENAIPIKSWFEDPHDRELLDLIPILKSLASVDDIRPVIRDVLLHLG